MQPVKQKARLGSREYECDLEIPDIEKVGYWIMRSIDALADVAAEAKESSSEISAKACLMALREFQIENYTSAFMFKIRSLRLLAGLEPGVGTLPTSFDLPL